VSPHIDHEREATSRELFVMRAFRLRTRIDLRVDAPEVPDPRQAGLDIRRVPQKASYQYAGEDQNVRQQRHA
jgi:hypothetical protein